MGNQLVGIAPSQIYPVEHYLTDHIELKFDTSLGSTRFFKVARAESQEGLIVVKVFAIHDPTLPLQPYKDCLDDIRIKLSSAVNCLPFQRIVVTEKAGLIMREYVKYSLYDRISTRPFLTNIEKRWITFQVLYALHQCHIFGVCHGDIKLENITVTAWNWVLLVDFASFKPTFLPEDNPADYSYFFDTSRRRTCYIAPERFIKTLSSESSSSMFNEAPCNSGELKPAMDIFSAGCALIELWNEGHAPFDLSQLLAYRTNEYSPQKHLDKIEDPSLKALLTSMIHRDPNHRLSAELYLSQERGKLFPEYFYGFLQPYMQIFSGNPILSSDEKIARLKKDIGNIFQFLHPENIKPEDGSEIEKQDSEKPNIDEETVRDDDGLVIITALVTSCIRGLHDCTSKLQSLEILLELATHANEETILDRILPYILYLAHDTNARVKVSAINMITQCLNLVKHIPRSDANIFPEYVLPGLAPLAVDPSTSVRAAYAQNIATLAEIALRFLEQTQTDLCDKTNGKNKEVPRINYEIELQTLHEMVQQSVSALLTDNQTLVKQTLMESGITKLCVFFGKQKANDVLLSHMITFLNDKEDKELRGSFFDCIVGVSAYIGWHCSIILTPLLLQGLTDCSEFVTTKSIHAMSSLTELGLITKPALCELVSECSSFLVHPSLWVRQAVAGFVSTAANSLTVLDVQCKIMPLLSIYMKYPLIQIDRPELLLESLVSPIPRTVFDSVIKYSDIQLLLDTLKERQNARLVASSGRIPSYGEMRQSLKSLFRRLVADGMADSVEDYLLMMSNHLKKIHKHKTSADAKHNKQSEGKIEIKTPIRTHTHNLSEARSKADLILQNRKLRRTQPTSPIDSNSNSDWNVIGAEVITRPSDVGPTSRPSTPPTEVHSAFVGVEHGVNISMHERSYIQYRTANCSVELRKLIGRQQDHYLEAVRSKDWAEQAAWQPQLPPPAWKPRGALVAHLHEHRGPVTKLAPLPDTSLFASCSRDGCIRIWDCAKMEGKNIANRSKQSYRVAGGDSVTGMAVCENGQSLAAATEDGSVIVLRIEPTSSKMTLVQARDLRSDDDDCAVDVQYLDSGPQSVLVYATLYGDLVGWDLRAPGIAWRLENGLKYGVITSFCLDSYQNWLTIGTSSGYHVAWDLRFQLPISTIEHPSGARIRKVISHPTEHSWIISSVQGNNEISMWNLETAFRQTTLWGSNSPPFSKVHGNNHSVCAMQAGCIDRSGYLMAGGTDQRLRFWDLENSSESYVVVHAPNDPLSGSTISYEQRLIDGTSVIYAVAQPNQSRTPGRGDEIPKAGPEAPSAAHRDCITDIALCKASQCFLLSASRDGVIKVWK